ncbi:MAG: aminotransferase class V-fold PLP-dependent enzyme [Bacteroidota bacterium]
MDISSKVRDHFPVFETEIYANTATCGLMHRDLMKWRRTHDLDFLNNGSTAKQGVAELLEDTRAAVAHLFNGVSQNVALAPSFSQGLNLLLEGLHPKEKILLLEEDYPSLNWPFESRGFQRNYVALGPTMETQIYEGIKRHHSTVFACSLVQWYNGIKIDLDFLKQLCTDFPELMVIADGTQFLGTESLDFEASKIAVLGSSGYKWMLSGYGNAFFMVAPHFMDRFVLKASGYGSGRNMKHLSEERTFCKHLEPGHLDSLSFGSLRYALSFFQEVGLDPIGSHNRTLSEVAKTTFGAMGLLEDAVIQRAIHSTIFNLRLDEASYTRLLQNGVSCARRGPGVRVAFHLYNTINDIATIAKLIEK